MVTEISNDLGNKVEFEYDYAGNRIKKKNNTGPTTVYVSSFYELRSDGIITKHIFDGIRRIVSKQNDGSCFWYHTDHLGSTGLLTDKNGKVVQQYSYYPFGSSRTNIGFVTNINYRFTGQEYDPETGLYNYNARLYDPVIGRFLSADTIIYLTYYSQDFNRYTYCRNNPVIYTDPSGHVVWIIPVLIGVAVGGIMGGIMGGTQGKVFSKEAWQHFNWTAAGIGAVAGAVSGGVGAGVGIGLMAVGLTGSLAADIAVGTLSGAAAGAATGN